MSSAATKKSVLLPAPEPPGWGAEFLLRVVEAFEVLIHCANPAGHLWSALALSHAA